jgi:uncharacterized ion transporter superfamily protein YfcC
MKNIKHHITTTFGLVIWSAAIYEFVFGEIDTILFITAIALGLVLFRSKDDAIHRWIKAIRDLFNNKIGGSGLGA